MWQRFTDGARRAILLAQQEAGQTGSLVVEPEHLLLGLLNVEESVGEGLLTSLGVDAAQRIAVLRPSLVRQGGSSVPDPKLTQTAKRILQFSADEARRLNHNYIGIEHLVLGVLRDPKSAASAALGRWGISLKKARAEVLRSGPPGEEAKNGGDRPSAEPRPRVKPSPEAIDHLRLNSTSCPQRVLLEARKVAGETGAPEVRPVHLLWAVLGDRDEAALRCLTTFGLSGAQVREKLRSKYFGTPVADPTESKVGREACEVVALALLEARVNAGSPTGSQHLLLALMYELGPKPQRILRKLLRSKTESTAAFLKDLGVESATVRAYFGSSIKDIRTGR